jgi:hypothetical protein
MGLISFCPYSTLCISSDMSMVSEMTLSNMCFIFRHSSSKSEIFRYKIWLYIVYGEKNRTIASEERLFNTHALKSYAIYFTYFVSCLFNYRVNTVYYIALNGGVIMNNRWEIKRPYSNWTQRPGICLDRPRTATEVPVGTVGVRTEIQIEDFPNKSQKRHFFRPARSGD